MISFGIATFNYVLRFLVIYAVQWIGYNTETRVLERVTKVTFLCQFFNSAFLLLLVNADFSEQPLIWGLNKGHNGDFNSVFFSLMGNTLISSMIFTAFYPIIGFLLGWLYRFAKRWHDRSFTFQKRKTKCTSTLAYKTLYSGASFYMYDKYSTVLNICFVTFMYGFGMPVLFPIAVLCFLVLYLVEKSMLYYSYKRPPMYDHRLQEMVISIMRFAPLFYLAFGYWMCSSHQLLSNDEISPKEFSYSTYVTSHTIG